MNDYSYILINKDDLETLCKEVCKSMRADNRQSNKTPFQKTEMLLYNYLEFERVIKDKQEQIEEIKRYGLRKKCGSIIPMPSGSSGSTSSIESVKEDERIELIEKSICLTRDAIDMITRELNAIKNDKYYPVIEMRYFKNMSMEEIAYELNCNVATISRNKNRLVQRLQIRFFSDEVIKELFGA